MIVGDGGGGYGEKKKLREVIILLIFTTFLDAKVNMGGQTIESYTITID